MVVGGAIEPGFARPRFETPFRVGEDHAELDVGKAALRGGECLLALGARLFLEKIARRLGVADFGALGYAALLLRRELRRLCGDADGHPSLLDGVNDLGGSVVAHLRRALHRSFTDVERARRLALGRHVGQLA